MSAIQAFADSSSVERRLKPAKSLLGSLFAPLDFLLAEGGDARLTVDAETRLNGYGCRPFPRPEAFTFASSTATSISDRAYAAADAARHALVAAVIDHDGAFDERIESLRARLLSLLGLAASGTEIVFSPSGTDAQLQALFLTETLLDGPLTSIVVAADETGSGTKFALTGKHFSTLTALGHDVVKGETLAGMDGRFARVDVAVCSEDGRPRTLEEIDAAVIGAVESAVGAGRKVLLQTMDRSKLWRRLPSQACLAEIETRFAQDVQVVVDACQMRLSPERIRTYLARGEMVLLTGSKFFTGPPFSGALLVPASLSARLEGDMLLPPGIGDYFNAGDWPVRFLSIRAQSPEGFNAGAWLRWEAALAEMEAYAAVPQSYRESAIRQFIATASRLIGEGGLELLPEDPRDASDTIDDGEFATRTILPFILRRNGEAISHETAAKMYHALNRDVSELLPASATGLEKLVAAQICHIGQPVAILTGKGEETAVLRISAGARILSDSWNADAKIARRNLDCECEQVRLIVEKIALLLRHQIGI